MVMEWVDGVKLSDAKGIEQMGFSLADVMTTATKAFSYQVWQHKYATSCLQT